MPFRAGPYIAHVNLCSSFVSSTTARKASGCPQVSNEVKSSCLQLRGSGGFSRSRFAEEIQLCARWELFSICDKSWGFGLGSRRAGVPTHASTVNRPASLCSSVMLASLSSHRTARGDCAVSTENNYIEFGDSPAL